FIDSSRAVRDGTEIFGPSLRLFRSSGDAKEDVVGHDPSRASASSLDADTGLADHPRVALGIGADARRTRPGSSPRPRFRDDTDLCLSGRSFVRALCAQPKTPRCRHSRGSLATGSWEAP